jgi:hypothetical protein
MSSTTRTLSIVDDSKSLSQTILALMEELLVAFEHCLETPVALRDLLCVDDNVFRYELLQKVESQMIYQALRLMEPHMQDMQAAVLNMMNTANRTDVVGNMLDSERNQALDRLKRWQERQAWQWPKRIMHRYVITGVLPAQYYKKGLEKCTMCKKEHALWETMNVADCWSHAFCDSCDLADGICPLCDLE